ncbi:MAG: tRNA (guanosine(46)-N7)-methyltransferase TrmB [Pirellulales bacterium]
MPRRSPRKVDPALDLERHLRTFEQLPQPWDAEAVFGASRPLEVELGTGKGLFLSAAASADPTTNFLGLEVSGKFAQYAASRLARRGLDNACVVSGDGLRVFREILPAASCRAVHVYFPDPWWKARHRKRRVMCPAFLADVCRTLDSGGRLHFWTDVEEYFQTSLELLTQFPELQGPVAVAERPPEHDLDYRTHFERRMRLHGQPIYRSEFVRA